MELKIKGEMEGNYEIANRVYSHRGGGCPTLPNFGHGKLTKVTRKYGKQDNGTRRFRAVGERRS